VVYLLEKRRLEKKLSLSQLAAKIGVTKGYLSRIEKHPQECNPTIIIILKLAKELDINPVSIFLYFVKNRKDQNN
jgi:transcriptional regulator with XRE-family HTH domain